MVEKAKYEGMLAETVMIQGAGGDMVGAYMARPLGPGRYPGVIVIHEAFGLMGHTRELVRKFASNGYVAVAPDLFYREHPVDPDDLVAVVQRMGGLPDARVVQDLEGAVNVLRSVANCSDRIGCIGYCSGGRHVLLFACNSRSLSAAVDCYGGRVVTQEVTPNQPRPVIDMISGLNCPVLGLFGQMDKNPSPEHVSMLEQELKRHGKEYDFHTYEGDVGHGFFAVDRPSYRQAAAVDGWKRIFDFFGRKLKG